MFIGHMCFFNQIKNSVYQDTAKLKNRLQIKMNSLPHTELTKCECEEYIQGEDSSLNNKKMEKGMTRFHRKPPNHYCQL